MGGEETNSVLLSVVLSLVVLGAISGTLVLFGTEIISSETPGEAIDSLDRLGANDGTDNDAITTETDHSVNASTDSDENTDAEQPPSDNSSTVSGR